MKILIIGERFSSNLGDPVICETVKEQILSSFPKSVITLVDISGRQDYERPSNKDLLKQGKLSSFKKKISINATKFGIDTEYIKFQKANKVKESAILEVCMNDYDLAIFAGGQLFKDTFIFPIAKFVKYLSEKNIPIIFNAVGVGQIVSKKMYSTLSDALLNPCVKSITTRDDLDTINNKLLKNKKTALKTYDPALWTNEVYNISKKNSEVVGLGVMFVHNFKYNDLENFWIRIIKDLDRKKIKWKLFCNGSMKDYLLALKILDKLGYSDLEKNVLLVKRPERAKELVEIISEFKSIISFRLHSHIIAYSLNIPGVALVWDDKLSFFYKNIKLANRCKSITDEESVIIAALKKAEIEGYDKDILISQKNFSKEQLINSIEKIVI